MIKFLWTIANIVGYVIFVRGSWSDSYGLYLSVLVSCFNLNMNEWVPMKGCIEVVLSNSVSTGKWYRFGTKT